MANAHPFATAGGGTHFENKVICLYAVDILCERFTHLGGLVASIGAQAGPDGFEDLTLELERPDGTHARVHVQCRHRQPLTGTNEKFKALLGQAWAAVSADRVAYASRQHRLLLVVDESSPGHKSLTELCRLARESPSAELFSAAVAQHGGQVAQRLEHCLTASGLPLDDLHPTLAALDAHAFSLDTPNEAMPSSSSTACRPSGTRPTRSGHSIWATLSLRMSAMQRSARGQSTALACKST